MKSQLRLCVQTEGAEILLNETNHERAHFFDSHTFEKNQQVHYLRRADVDIV